MSYLRFTQGINQQKHGISTFPYIHPYTHTDNKTSLYILHLTIPLTEIIQHPKQYKYESISWYKALKLKSLIHCFIITKIIKKCLYQHGGNKFPNVYKMSSGKIITLESIYILLSKSCTRQRNSQNKINTKLTTDIQRWVDKDMKDYRKKYNTGNTLGIIPTQLHTINYTNQTHSSYKIDEHTIKNHVIWNTNCTTPNNKLGLIIYYKNTKMKSFPISNAQVCKPEKKPQITTVIY